MKRYPRYRVWDTQEKKIILHATRHLNKYLDDYERYIFLQGTGKYGKAEGQRYEIHEGDLVKYNDTIYLVKWHDELPRFELVSKDGVLDSAEVWNSGELEFIGIIFEQPDLYG